MLLRACLLVSVIFATSQPEPATVDDLERLARILLESLRSTEVLINLKAKNNTITLFNRATEFTIDDASLLALPFKDYADFDELQSLLMSAKNAVAQNPSEAQALLVSATELLARFSID